MGIIWNGKIGCGENLARILKNTMAKFGTKFPEHGIRTSIHTKFSQGSCVLGIELGVTGTTVQYFNNSTTTRACYSYVKQGSYLEHDVVVLI